MRAPSTPFEPDDAQARALEHEAGPLLVTGPAGTGKTALLRERFARLIEGAADPERVALVVGSRRARAAAREALRRRLPIPLPTLHVATVHGLAYRIVNERCSALGYTEPPQVLTAADQFAKVQELLDGEDPAGWPAYGGLLRLRGFADQVRQLVLRAQEALRTPEEIEELADRAGLSGWKELAAFHRRYLQVLDAAGQVDFAGLVEQAAVAAGGGEPPFEHVLLDDYQDTTFAAERLLAELRARSLVVTGDPDAHVFSFQGTTVEPLERFAERFGAPTVELSLDHRGARRRVQAWIARHTSEEHSAVARELRRVHVEEDVAWRELAVVVRRQSAHVGSLLRALDDAGVPRQVPESGLSLASEPATVPYVLALRWIARPAERDDLAEAVLTSELGGLSPGAARALLRATRGAGGSAADALGRAEGLTPAEAEQLAELGAALADAGAVAHSIVEAFRELWRRLPVSRRLVDEAERSTEASRGLDAVLALAHAVERAGGSGDTTVAGFVEALEAGAGGPGFAAEREGDRDAVQVLTAHGATGMELDTVIVVGAVEGDFPSLARPEPMFDLEVLERRVTRSERIRARLADEGRLFRSVLGRARRRVLLVASDPHGGEEGIRSRFVGQLGVEWHPVPDGARTEPVSVAEAAAEWRRTLADRVAPSAERLAAIDGLLQLGIRPERWWFQRDWTDTGLPLHETLRLSYSRLSTLENCELQFVLGEELGLSQRGGHQAWVGKLVHDLIERCEKGRIERSQEALLDALEREWEPERFPSRAVSEAFKQLAMRQMIPNWWKYYGELPAVASEVGFAFAFDGAVISGKIDRIGPHPEGFRITDFKTGKADNAPKAEESLQLGIYYLAVNEAPELAEYRPIRAVDLSYIRGHWRDGDLVSRAWPVSTAGEEGYQETVRGSLSQLISRIRELDDLETYRPDPNASCFFCDFKTLCPLFAEGQPLFPIEEVAPA